MATVTLGNIKFNWKGAWNSGTAYVVDDVVSLSGSSYVCIQAGTNQNPSTATAYWEQMSSAGTNGTDLTTTLTTQGDILYRDGSGLQRLGAGTSGQVLQTGGSGANPSWGTVSSDYVRLNTTSITNGVSGVNMDGVFNSTYNTYKVFLTDIKGSDSTNGSSYIKLRNSNANMTGSYWAAGQHSYRQSGSSNGGNDGQWGGSEINFGGWNIPDTDTESGNATYNYEITFFNVNSSNYKHVHYQYNGWEQGNTYTVWQHGHALLNNTGSMDGFNFSKTAGGLSSDGKIIVYGLKHS